MSRTVCERDLEKGDIDEHCNTKITDNEKRAVFESEQSSPTLTQGTFESDRDAKGMKLEFDRRYEVSD